MAVLSSSEIEGLNTTAMQAAYPVRVDFMGVSEAVAASTAVTRVSPRGNESTMQQHLFSETGGTWYSKSNYFQTIRVYAPPEAHREVTGVTIHIGSTSHSVGAPEEGSEHWRAVAQKETDLPKSLSSILASGPTVYEYVPSPRQSPGTLAPGFGGILNYIGDFRLALWSLLWALLVVVPIALATPWIIDESAALGPVVVRWLGFLLGVSVVAATAGRFLNVSSMPLEFVNPAGRVSSALSISFVVILLGAIASHRQPLELWPSQSTDSRKNLFILALITAVGFFLRVIDLDSLMRVDMYNLSAALSLHDTGGFSYPRNVDLTKTLGLLFDWFDRSIETAKIPFLIAGTLTIPLVYTLGRFVSDRLAMLSAAVFALAPNHIAMAGHVREYSINLTIGTLFLICLFATYKKLSHHRVLFPIAFLGVLGSGFGIVLVYSAAANNGTVPAVAQAGAFASLPLVLHYISRHFRALMVPAILIAVALFALGFSFLYAFGPFSREILFQPSFVRAYLNPLSLDSMQTFSMAAVSTFSIGGLLLAPLVLRGRSPYLDAIMLAFWGTLVVYSLKLTAGGSDRYLYHVAALHNVLLAAGVLAIFSLLSRRFLKSKIAGIGGLLLLLVLVNPVNSVQGALNSVPNYTDLRRPTGLSGGDYYKHLAEEMRQYGADTATPIVEAGSPPYLSSIVFDRRFTRRWYAEGDIPHETGAGIYPVKWRHGADQSLEAFRDNAEGLLVTDEYVLFPVGKDFRLGDIDFTYEAVLPHPHDPFTAYILYRWSVTGPDLRAIGSLSDSPGILAEGSAKPAGSTQND